MFWPTGEPPDSISDLFILLYLQAATWNASDRSTAANPGRLFRIVISKFLEKDDESLIVSLLSEKYQDGLTGVADARGRVLSILGAIDELFYRVHPRAVIGNPRSPSVALPRWLKESRDRRTYSGRYAVRGERVLLPRGPLLRGPRDVNASSGDDLADRFAALSVAHVQSHVGGAAIDIDLKVVSTHHAHGVMPPASSGREVVGFVPVAEQGADLRCSFVNREGQPFADFRPAPDFDASSRFVDAISKLVNADLVVAPEAVMPVAASERVSERLRELGCANAKLILAGTGVTNELVNGQPFNEARLLNGAGFEVARQRKLWPAGVKGDRARQCGLPNLGDDVLFLEDSASGRSVIVLDCDGFGRVVVLICQDLQARPFADDLVREFQPDWVLVPILDIGADVGRWAHQRAFELSSVSQARFLISCSGSMADWTGDTGPKRIGLAIGPKELSERKEGQIDRAIMPVTSTTTNPSIAVVVWGGEDWSQSTLSAKPAC